LVAVVQVEMLEEVVTIEVAIQKLLDVEFVLHQLVVVEVDQIIQQELLVDLEVAEVTVQVTQKQDQVRPIKEQMEKVVEKAVAAVEPALQQVLTTQVVVVYLLLLQVQLLPEAAVLLKKVVVEHPHLEQVAVEQDQEILQLLQMEQLTLVVAVVEPAETLIEPEPMVEKVLLF
jgi:mevalonate kinase